MKDKIRVNITDIVWADKQFDGPDETFAYVDKSFLMANETEQLAMVNAALVDKFPSEIMIAILLPEVMPPFKQKE